MSMWTIRDSLIATPLTYILILRDAQIPPRSDAKRRWESREYEKMYSSLSPVNQASLHIDWE